MAGYNACAGVAVKAMNASLKPHRDARKKEARMGVKAGYAKALCRGEPVRRSRSYRKHVKKDLSRSRRLVDQQAITEGKQDDEL